MRTTALLGAVSFVVLVGACGGAKGLPKGPAPEYEDDPVLDAGSTPAPTAPASPGPPPPDAGGDGATSVASR